MVQRHNAMVESEWDIHVTTGLLTLRLKNERLKVGDTESGRMRHYLHIQERKKQDTGQQKPDKNECLPVYECSEKRSQEEELLRQFLKNKNQSNNGRKRRAKQLLDDGPVTAN